MLGQGLERLLPLVHGSDLKSASPTYCFQHAGCMLVGDSLKIASKSSRGQRGNEKGIRLDLVWHSLSHGEVLPIDLSHHGKCGPFSDDVLQPGRDFEGS